MSDRDAPTRDWRRLLPTRGQAAVRLRQLLLGGTLAGMGLFAIPKGVLASQAPPASPNFAAPPTTISERGKRAARLVLTLPGVAKNLLTQHRSHSSHSSHSSHTSHYSGSGGSSSPATPVAPAVPTTPTRSLTPSVAPGIDADTLVGVVEKIDRVKRTFSLRTSGGLREFAFRDDTQFEVVAGVAVRLDEYLEAHPHLLPFAEKERVSIKWRTTATQSLVATHVSPSKP